ncbi:MAG: hypothetical protein IJG18_07515 [Kiritimatiellae bacterium]|nr:hypothetical protein [Kiritimatiellia bacterium]
MKIKGQLVLSALAAAATLLAVADSRVESSSDAQLFEFFTADRAPVGSEIQLGVWNSDIDACIELAKETGIPMIGVWSREGCAHCKILEHAIMSDVFREWIKKSGLILGFSTSLDSATLSGADQATRAKHYPGVVFDEGGGRQQAANPASGTPTGYTGDGRYWKWCKGPENLSNYPEVRFFWYEDGKKKVDFAVLGDKVDGQQGIYMGSYDKAGQNCINYITNKTGFKPYLDNPKSLSSYMGGTFEDGYTDGNRLEAEEGTGEISFDMVRGEAAAAVATNNTVKVVGPDKQVAETVVVEWEEGEDQKTVTVDMSKVNFSKNGDKALLIAVDADGNEQATNTVTYVTGSGESSGNPLWIGERKATTADGDIPVLQFGEWTMDLDVAKAKVADADGDAFTLVSVQGALWCPDCANTERNFTDVEDGSGNNRFAAWAAANQVALVAIDVPSFATNNIDNISRPTLLSRKAISTTLARAREYPASGAEASLTNAMVRSGLGYLTRKGVSDEVAADYLERNRQLVTTDFSEGGFHSVADSSPFRTGVPIFVVLDKEGIVKARLTRFASVSPMSDLDWDSAIKRFDELLAIARDGSAHADGGVLENDFPSADLEGFTANGGRVSGEISHCDFRDVYKLQNFGGNAVLQVDAVGESDAEVSLAFVTLDAAGRKTTVTNAVGRLSDGVSLRNMFASAGEYYVEISGASYDAADFAVANPTALAFHTYTLSGAVVLVPGEVRSTASAPEGQTTVTMELVEGTRYRIEGLADDPGDSLEKSGEDFYVAKTTGSAQLSVATAGGEVVYQIWNPGSVGFVAAAKKVKESVGDVEVAIARTEGTSGAVTVKVALDEDATTLYDSDGKARFAFAETEITWAEGANFTTNLTISVYDDTRFDGNGDVALKLALVADENGDTTLGLTNYVLTVTEDDKQSAGKAAFTGAEPFFSKKATVYARESEGATVYAERIEASDGFVTVKVNATNGAKTEIGGVETNVVVWANHKSEFQAVKVTGIAAGKSAKLTLVNPTDGLKVLSASNAVTVVAVADDAPAFDSLEEGATLYRYAEFAASYPVVGAAEGAKLTFTKLSGTLPAGLKVAADGQAMSVSGIPSAKPGTYVAVYQVSQKVGTKTTPGLTIELEYEIVDPTDASAGGTAYNEAVASVNSRTIKDIAMIALNKDIDAADTNRLAGLLQVTIPKTGKLSAKLACSDGTVAFSAKGWSEFNEVSRSLVADLTSNKAGYSMTLVAENDGPVTVSVTTPTGVQLSGITKGKVWSKTNPASDWMGYYTIQLINNSVSESSEGVAPRGNGYLTLKMNTAAAVNSGKVTWAGMLPNGTAVSGSVVLNADDECGAQVFVYKRSSTDEISSILEIPDCESVAGDLDTGAFWKHTEKSFAYEVGFNAYGALYVATTNLAEACEIGYETTTPTLYFDIEGLCGALAGGTPSAVDGVKVSVGEKTVTVEKGNAAGATISLNRSTGVATGSFKIPYTDAKGAAKTMTANFKGVVVIGWGPGCGCGDDDPSRPVALPFVNGAFFVSDKVGVAGGTKTATVKRGGAIFIDK